MSDDLIKRSDAIEALGEEPYVWTDDDEFAQGERSQWIDDVSAIKAVPSAEIPQWIPTCDRLPNEKEVVLITNDKGNVRCGQFRGTHGKYWIWKGNTLETVLAWMPLPDPWKGAGDESDSES